MEKEKYLVPRKNPTNFSVVSVDFGTLPDPSGDDPIRTFLVEPGVDSVRECLWSFRQRPDGSLYQRDDAGPETNERGEIEIDLLEELPTKVSEGPPEEPHYGFRAHAVGKVRWWNQEQARRGQFDVITEEEFNQRKATAKIPVFDYDFEGWD